MVFFKLVSSKYMIWWTSEGRTTRLVSYLSGYLLIWSLVLKASDNLFFATKLICRECGYIMKEVPLLWHLQQFSKAFPKICIDKVVCRLKVIIWWKEVPLQGRRSHALHKFYDIMIQYTLVSLLTVVHLLQTSYKLVGWVRYVVGMNAWSRYTSDEYNKYVLHSPDRKSVV